MDEHVVHRRTSAACAAQRKNDVCDELVRVAMMATSWAVMYRLRHGPPNKGAPAATESSGRYHERLTVPSDNVVMSKTT